jgi:hypothetical protein
MAIIKISELPAASTPVASTDVVPALQNGVTKKAAINQLGFLAAGISAATRTIESKLRDVVSVKDFGAVGDGVNDDTAAIQAAFNNSVRKIYLPAGTYKITSTLTVQYGAIIFGDGCNNEIQGHSISSIVSHGNFNALSVNATGFFGFITIKNLRIAKSAAPKTNSGLKITNFAPHVVLESVLIEGYDIGFDLYTGIAQVNSCNARFNNVGFLLNGTSTTYQNCYANRNTTGFKIANSVYSALISCAADSNTGNAYEFVSPAPPETSGGPSAGVIKMMNCGAEDCGRYLYVDGNFSVSIEAPTNAVTANTVAPYFAYIEYANKVHLNQLDAIGVSQWLYVNQAKNQPDVVQVEGSTPFLNVSGSLTPLFPNVPLAQSEPKSLVGVFGFAATKIPGLGLPEDTAYGGGGASSERPSYISKTLFLSPSSPADRLRFRVRIYSNGNSNSAQIKVSQFRFFDAALDTSATIDLLGANAGGIATLTSSSSSDFTILEAQETGPSSTTYRDFFINSTSNSVWYLWDVKAVTNWQPYGEYSSNWGVKNADKTTTGDINSGTATLTVASGTGITNGMQIIVVGAGVAGADLLTKVSSGGGTTTLTLANNASTTVTGAAVSAYAV